MGNQTIQLQIFDEIRRLTSQKRTFTVVISDPCDTATLKLSPAPTKPLQYELR